MSGRWTSPDPLRGTIAAPQSFNAYTYAANDPVNFVDPTGLDPNGVLGGLLGSIANMGPGTSVVDVPISFDRPINGGSATDGTDWLTLAVINRSELNQGSGEPLKDALDAARAALKDPEGDCAKLFAKGNGLEKLNDLDKNGKIKIGDTNIPKQLSPNGKLSGAPGIGAYAKYGKIFLNSTSSVVKGTLNPGAAVFGGMSNANALATLIIHEMRHITKDIPSESLERYREESLLNSQDVKDACFPGK